jgi:flavodoxin
MSQNDPKVLIYYWSATGNTEKVAVSIQKALEREGIKSVMKKIHKADTEDLYNYDLVFMGSPSYTWAPPEPVRELIHAMMDHHRKHGDIKPRAPKIPGKKAVTFVTYSGPHTGIDEATPAGKYLGQFFAHLGFEVVAEWYVVGEFHKSLENSTKGVLGDIRGRPNQQDLAEVESNVAKLIKSIKIT